MFSFLVLVFLWEQINWISGKISWKLTANFSYKKKKDHYKKLNLSVLIYLLFRLHVDVNWKKAIESTIRFWNLNCILNCRITAFWQKPTNCCDLSFCYWKVPLIKKSSGEVQWNSLWCLWRKIKGRTDVKNQLEYFYNTKRFGERR